MNTAPVYLKDPLLDKRFEKLVSDIHPISHNLFDRVKNFEHFKELFETSFLPVDYRPDENDCTLLQVALALDNDDIAHFLLDQGANVNLSDPEGVTALRMVCFKPMASLDLFKRILQHTDDINSTNICYSEDSCERVPILAELCWNYVCSFYGRSSEVQGWKENTLSRIKMLIDAGADPNINAGWETYKGDPIAEQHKTQLKNFIAQYKETKKQLETTKTSCYDYDFAL